MKQVQTGYREQDSTFVHFVQLEQIQIGCREEDRTVVHFVQLEQVQTGCREQDRTQLYTLYSWNRFKQVSSFSKFSKFSKVFNKDDLQIDYGQSAGGYLPISRRLSDQSAGGYLIWMILRAPCRANN